MNARRLNSTAALALAACAISSPANAALDLGRLQSACTAAAAAPSPARSAALADLSIGEWTKFGQGKITEASDDKFVMDSSETPLLTWDKVFQYWVATRNESLLHFPFGVSVDAGGRPNGTTKASYMDEVNAVRRAFAADPQRQARITSALRRSGISAVPWSAVFISTMFKLGGYSSSEFEGSASHSIYMRSAIRAFNDGRAVYGQLPCDPAWVKPRVGDLVCFSRTMPIKSWADVLARWGNTGGSDRFAFESHCDVVVHVSPTTIDSVGGNLGDSVKKTERPTAGGFLRKPAKEAATGTGWLMVLVLTR
ncbi:DUF2272 domain-containing protein [Hydrogenophaga flava]|uniref:DUF2272 domain-containing protein n=1 Tax=Hydrogenophaga flava TaxID=65657 RepID=UPI0008244BA7|nr:DUF2272 domain-containing protein [Hydrogenophaga flava]